MFSRSESNILPLQGSDCRRSAGVEEAVEIFYPLVSFSPASTAGECIYMYLMHISEILLNLNSKESNFPPFYPVCAPQVPLVAVDSYFYGKLVIAPLNILLYNVFTPHGPDLYGMFLIV